MRCCLTILCSFFFVIVYSQNNVSILTQHNNLQRTGWNDKEKILNHANVSGMDFGLIGSLGIDDQVYAQPLLVQNLAIGNYTGSVLFTATVNNTVYAFNADDVTQPAPLWQVSLNPPGQRAPDIFDLKDPQEGAPCGGNYRDFSGRIGLVGTPVIDTATQTLYVATKTIDNNGNFFAYINALDLQTGIHKSGSPRLIEASADGNGAGSVNGKVKFLAKYHNQRAALLLYQNTVYIAFASHCDWGPYHGWILGYDAANLNLKYTYNATANGWAGGIWMAGQGISVGEDGNLFVVTGNGTTSADNNDYSGGRSESLIKLSPQLHMLDWYTPSNFKYLDDLDLDYGCDGVLMVPNSSLTISGSKEGISYVVDFSNMGRYNAENSQVNDTLEFNPNRQGYVHVHGSPVFAKLNNGEFVYAWAETFKIRQFTLDRGTGTFNNSFKEGTRTLDNGMPGAMLSVSSNGQDTGSAIVWASFPTSGNANNQVRPGSVAAYRANDVSAGELWSTDLNSRNIVGDFSKFNSPTVANGKLFIPTFSNAVKVYGLSCNSAANNLPAGNGSGLKAAYFSDADPGVPFPAEPTLTQLDKNINFNWADGSPAKEISKDNFKARWTGNLLPLSDETYTFYVTASDGVRLWINDELLVDSWKDQPVTTHTASLPLQKTGTYSIKLEYYSRTNPASCILQWGSTGLCRQNIPATQLKAITASCNSNGTGLTAEYFSNSNAAGTFPATPTITKTEPFVFFDWAGAAPTGISTDNFKARFSGFVQALDSGTYTFYVTADDGVRLWVNGQLLVNKWIDQGATEYSGTIKLKQCGKVPILLEYYENGGDAVCKLEWSTPIGSRQAIPTSQLYTEPGQDNSNPFFLFPNPAYDEITVVLKPGLHQGDVVLIYNMLGQQVSKTTVASSVPGKLLTIPVKNLATGMYLVKLVSGSNKFVTKFIKQ
jgi:hypothetical protein